MPSPVGHGLAGLSAVWIAQALRGGSPLPASTARTLLVAAVALALLPDLDLLLPGHRGPTHSLGAVLVVAAVSAAVAVWRGLPVGTVAAACSLAYGSHVLLDWLGRDTADPIGLMALWPLSTRYYASGVDFFRDVSRQYWIPEEFIFGNLQSIGWELAVLGSVALVAWWWKQRAATEK